jgi:hypothetical protein
VAAPPRLKVSGRDPRDHGGGRHADDRQGEPDDHGGFGLASIAAVTAASTDNQKTDSPVVGWTG